MMDYCGDKNCSWHTRVPVDMMAVLHWNYRGFKEFPEDIMKSRSDIITDVYLKENSITEFPRDLWQFKILKNLYLSGNDIKILPKEIGLLTSLKSLDLSGNLLAFVPEEISQLENLKCLILDDNAITHLPLSLDKLRKLRYLSVCDNQLTWLPQRPVSNYYAAEFRFWRNRTLQHIPFSLWLHMLRDQQIRLQNIGCFGYPYTYKHELTNRIRVVNNFVIPDTEIVLPDQYEEIQKYPMLSPPTLCELSLRKCYSIISDADEDALNNNLGPIEPHRLEKMAEDVLKMKELDENNNSMRNIFDHLLPNCLRDEINNGPTAICEFYTCKSPLFRSTILDITSRSTTTLDGSVDILVSAFFCSGSCCEKWRKANRVSPFKWIKAV